MTFTIGNIWWPLNLDPGISCYCNVQAEIYIRSYHQQLNLNNNDKIDYKVVYAMYVICENPMLEVQLLDISLN